MNSYRSTSYELPNYLQSGYVRGCDFKQLSSATSTLLTKSDKYPIDLVEAFLDAAKERVSSELIEGDNTFAMARTLVYRLNGKILNSKQDWDSEGNQKLICEGFGIALDSSKPKASVQSMVYLEFGGYYERLFSQTKNLLFAQKSLDLYSKSEELAQKPRFMTDALCAKSRLIDKILKSHPLKTYWQETSNENYTKLRQSIDFPLESRAYSLALLHECLINEFMFYKTKDVKFVNLAAERLLELIHLPNSSNVEYWGRMVRSAGLWNFAFHSENDQSIGEKAASLWLILGENTSSGDKIRLKMNYVKANSILEKLPDFPDRPRLVAKLISLENRL
ncbi:MAG: hypothetical protein KAQ83_01460 [Nanoarchaeota archaeon]|nr:hypothetical protein [Nanoarchaeota archaeon]